MVAVAKSPSHHRISSFLSIPSMGFTLCSRYSDLSSSPSLVPCYVTVQLSFVFTISLFPFRSSIAFFILITSTAYASDPRYPAFPSSPSFVAYVLDTYIMSFVSMYRLAAVLSLRLPCTIVVMYRRHHAPSSLLSIICILSLFVIVRRCYLKSNHQRHVTSTIQIMSRLSGVRPGEGSTVTNVVIAT